MLFGTCVFYYGIAAYLNSPIALVLVALFMAFMLIFVKKTEERRLLEDFGSDYQEYRRRVSMFVPWRQKRSEPPTN
jgi:protein-S-isoprenylcysteine O-methyltransferase Ste14